MGFVHAPGVGDLCAAGRLGNGVRGVTCVSVDAVDAQLEESGVEILDQLDGSV